MLQVLSDAAVLKRQAKEIEELRKMLTGTGYATLPYCFMFATLANHKGELYVCN